MNENKKMRSIINQDSMIILGMVLVAIVLLSMGTYAYSFWISNDTEGELTTTIGDLATIKFDNGVNISSDSLYPVSNYEDGTYLTYEITKTIDNTLYTKMYLSIVEIDEELINESLKYILIDTNNNLSIASGNFKNLTNNNLTIINNYAISQEKTNYKLYIYIDGKMNNTNMENKKLNVILNISASEDMIIEATQEENE